MNNCLCIRGNDVNCKEKRLHGKTLYFMISSARKTNSMLEYNFFVYPYLYTYVDIYIQVIYKGVFALNKWLNLKLIN